MSKRSIIHMFTPMAHTSPFDINMAIDAGYDIAFPHQNMQLAEEDSCHPRYRFTPSAFVDPKTIHQWDEFHVLPAN